MSSVTKTSNATPEKKAKVDETDFQSSSNGKPVWKEIELKTTWGTLRGKKYGQGERKILGVHGWLDNANTFDEIVPLLRDDFTLVSLDLPGHGKSDHFEKSFIYDPRGYVGSIRKAADALEWSRFTYMGHSMGAVVGIIFCATFPELVDSFILVDIIKPWSEEAHQFAPKLRKYFDSYFSNESKVNLPPLIYSKEELIQKTVEGSRNSLNTKSAEILLQRGSIPSEDGTGYVLTRDLRAKTYFIGFFSSEVWISFARTISCPILIIKVKFSLINLQSEPYQYNIYICFCLEYLTK